MRTDSVRYLNMKTRLRNEILEPEKWKQINFVQAKPAWRYSEVKGASSFLTTPQTLSSVV